MGIRKAFLVWVLVFSGICKVYAEPIAHAPEPSSPSKAPARSSMPVPMPSPITGERGIWIPQWLQAQHLSDDANLRRCMVELATADDEIFAQHQELNELYLVIERQEEALAKLSAERAMLVEDEDTQRTKARRRAAVLWAVFGGFVVTGAAVTFAFAR